MASDLAARELGQLLDTRRVVALVGHTDEGVAGSGEVDHLGRAREQRDYAQDSATLLLLVEVSEQGGLTDVVGGEHPDEVAVLDDGQSPKAALL